MGAGGRLIYMNVFSKRANALATKTKPRPASRRIRGSDKLIFAQERFVFQHRWGVRDVVMWDNRCTMHCATPYDTAGERRVIHRTVTLV